MIVMKFGGSSVASAENIKNVAQIIQEKTEPKTVVVSALGGVTDDLLTILESSIQDIPYEYIERVKLRHIEVASQLGCSNKALFDTINEVFEKVCSICVGVHALGETTERITALMMSFGELLSSKIIYEYFNVLGLAFSYFPSQEKIIANGTYQVATLDKEQSYSNIQSFISLENNFIAPGFIGCNHKGEIVTLGRGGSDYTSAIIAAAVQAERLEIWSDVDGMLSANPKIVKSATQINKLTYEEAFELSYFGAKVLYPPTIKPLVDRQIPLVLKNTFSPDAPGTFINNQKEEEGDYIKGVSALNGIGLLNISGTGMAHRKGLARRVFEGLESAQVNAIMITQCCSEQSICIGIKEEELSQAKLALNQMFNAEIQSGLLNEIQMDDQYSIIAIIGDRMINKIGLSGKVFSVLGENGINIKAIAQGASERNISLVVHKDVEDKAVNVLHEAFFSTNTKKVHLYIAGKGNVGGEFLQLLDRQKQYLQDSFNLELIPVLVCDSKNYIHKHAESVQDIEQVLQKEGKAYKGFEAIVETIKSDNLRNAIFIDNTASEYVSSFYESILRAGASIVTCNKIACSGPYDQYKLLVDLAKEQVLQFKYETCVGAALPVIKSIQDLVLSGDKIHAVKAVLSGSLNYIFNAYDGSKPFAEVVHDAKTLGFTEPNPLIDLSGTDAIRKILILARESGLDLEFDQVENNSFLPEACLNASNADQLLDLLLANEAHFKQLYDTAKGEGKRLKVVASFEGGNATFGLEAVGREHPFYHLNGKDNIFLIHSDRYKAQPLIIKGAGAGAEITASGVFSDLMLIVNK